MAERRIPTIANKAIKGLTIEIGGDTTNLGKALDDVTKQSKNLSGELSQVNRMLKLDPGNADLLTQKQQILTNAIADTSKKLEVLKTAEAQVQDQFEKGDVSEAQVRELQREIMKATQELDKLEKAAEETEDALKGLGDKADDAAEEIEDTADNSKDAEGALSEMGDSALDVAKTGLAALAAAAAAAVASIVAIAEESREYRTAMGKLDTAFTDNGHNAEVAYKAYSELQGVLGETDQAVEAAAFLADLCDTEEDLAEWTEICTGIYGRFGASLPIEGLTEAANETAKTGTVTGGLADALNWAVGEEEDFGLSLKENIKFTEKSADELKNMTKKQQEEYEARKEQYEAIEDYNTRLEEATTAEGKFNLALENCTDEQERQQLITKTLTKYYKGAATQYKETNKEVIRANKATEEWNKSMANIGGYMEPVITDIKELGVSLLQKAEKPLKNIADFIRNKFIPALVNISNWCNNNKATIIGVVTGLTAAMIAFKTASLSAKLAEEGLTIATVARTAAQKALNVVMAATPAGLVMTAVAGLTAAMVAYGLALSNEATPRVEALTEEEKKLMEASSSAADAFRDQMDATSQNAGRIQAEMGAVTELKDELLLLADSSGKVKEKDQERVNFILNELNEALGTEYEMVGGVIQEYGKLTQSINDVILAKTANSLIEAANADYITALQEEDRAMQAVVLAEKDYAAQLDVVDQKEAEVLEKKKEYDEQRKNIQNRGDERRLAGLALQLGAAQEELNKEKTILDEKQTALEDAAADYQLYNDTIIGYKEAQTAVSEGNYQKAVDLLTDEGVVYGNYADTVDEETKRAVDTLLKKAVDAGIAAKRTKDNFEKGVDGYTKEMVDESEKAYQDAMDAYADAYADANAVGKDLGGGLKDGMENERSGLVSKAKSLVNSIIGAMREAADSNSPAQKTIDFGEDLGEGAEIGVENKTKDVAAAARRQTIATLKAYAEPAAETPSVFRSIAETQALRREQSYQAAAAANNGILGEILKAIQAGQVIALDGKTLVGGTTENMDTSLGQRRILVARGAK